MIQQPRMHSEQRGGRSLPSAFELDAAEWLEAQALHALHTSCPKDVAASLELSWLERRSARLSLARNEHSILLNRALGLDAASPSDLNELQTVAQLYERAGVSQYLVQLYRPSGSPTESQLTTAGWVKARGWRKFYRDLRPPAASRTALTVRRLRGNDQDGARLASFASIVAAAFGLSPAVEPALRGLNQDPRYHLFVSLDGERVVGTGALFTARHPDSGRWLGWLDFGATAPEHRRRGSQNAVMAARIEYARQLGCDALITTTGEAVPGDPQHSYHNILRNGFLEGPLRENWRRTL